MAGTCVPESTVGRGRPQGGFTLIEMLMVVTIMSLIATGVASSFLSGMRLWGRVRHQDAAYTAALLALEAIAKELRQSVELASVRVEGKAQELSFPSVNGTSVVKVTYAYDPRTKRLWRKQVELREIIEETLQPHVIEGPVLLADGLTMTFAAPDTQETEGSEWRNEWKPEDGLPVAIRFEIRLHDDTITKTVFLPIA